MSAVSTSPLPVGQTGRLRGRILVLAGILLVGITLRMAVTAVSPLIARIDADIPLSAADIAILGTLPTATFAVFGFMTPYVVRWASLEKLLGIALAAAVCGQLLRAVVSSTPLFMVFSVVALAGLGAGNVLLPPLVKKYFPDKIGLLTALYSTALALGTAFPAQFAVPVAVAFDWRVSIGLWAGVSLVAAIPWILVVLEQRRRPAPKEAADQTLPGTTANPRVRINLWRSPLALGLTLMFGCTSLQTYAIIAWLPQILTEAGLSASNAGSMLALFAVLGLPLSLVVPLLAARMRNPFPAVVVFFLCFAGGYTGLLLVPATVTWLWVMLVGLGPGTFPLALVLINLRTRTQAGAGALSGFAQGVGYALGSSGPLLFGILQAATGGWTASFAFLGVALVLLAGGAFVACRPVMLEDRPGVVRPRPGPVQQTTH